MKICFTIKRLEGMAGGAERVFTTIANGLAQKGHNITVLSFDMPGAQSFYPIDPQITWLQHPVGYSALPSTTRELCKRIIDTRQTLKNLRPDIVISFMHSSFIPTAIAAIGLSIKVIGSEHIVAGHYKGRPLDRILYNLAMPFLSRVTVLSEAVKTAFPKTISKKMTVISNPVSKPEGSQRLSSQKSILTIGRLNPQKDQKTLIAAFSRLSSDYPDWNLTITGDGTLHADLAKQIKSLDMENRVTLQPSTRNIGALYSAADIFVIPSLYESFGMVTVEAMMYGLPCIGFRSCPGTNEIILDNETGYLIADTPDRVTSLAAALKVLMENETERTRLGQAGLTRSEIYSAAPIIKKWETLINEVRA